MLTQRDSQETVPTELERLRVCTVLVFCLLSAATIGVTNGWLNLSFVQMGQTREVALGLREQSKIEILQKGKPVVGAVKGPIRLRLVPASGYLTDPRSQKRDKERK